MHNNELIPHLFKTEYSKLVSVLAKSFGLDQIELAEDIASETFLAAMESWPYKGIPPNPTAWLYTSAKNKTINYLNRKKNYQGKLIDQHLRENQFDEIQIDFSKNNILDSQLKMLFTICHPSISNESQISLALKILCGLGLDEIATAFVTNKETIHKRIQRAKAVLQKEEIKMELLTDEFINERFETVLNTIYLLFSEGYYSESNKTIVREELCVEAMNLTYLLLQNQSTNNHYSNSLMALMCFQSSRMEARKSIEGEVILYDDQDRNLWNTALIEKGFYYLQQASKWQIGSTYYIEASIAYWHTIENTNPDKWRSILKLYDALLAINNTSIVALNRIWAYAKIHGNIEAIEEIEKTVFTKNHFYYILLAELYINTNVKVSIDYLNQAMELCKNATEKEQISKHINSLKTRYNS